MRIMHRLVTVSMLLVMLLGSTSCTPEKAKALQTAATSFSSESESAITTLQSLLSEDVGASIGADSNAVEETVNALLKEKSIDAAHLSELLKGSTFQVPALAEADKEFAALQAQYAQFAAMYQALDRGYLFAGKSVKESEAVSIKLTVQMINFADMIKSTPFQLRGRRVLLIEEINRANQLQDDAARTEALRSAAQDAVTLRQDEAIANDQAIRQCLKAAEAGRAATALIKDFDRMSIADMLSLVNDSLSFISDISKDSNVENVLKKYQAIQSNIEADPYWSAILGQTLNPESTHATRQ